MSDRALQNDCVLQSELMSDRALQNDCVLHNVCLHIQNTQNDDEAVEHSAWAQVGRIGLSGSFIHKNAGPAKHRVVFKGPSLDRHKGISFIPKHSSP